jgi:hypothetical protein
LLKFRSSILFARIILFPLLGISKRNTEAAEVPLKSCQYLTFLISFKHFTCYKFYLPIAIKLGSIEAIPRAYAVSSI